MLDHRRITTPCAVLASVALASGSMTGKLDKAHSKASGTWQLKGILRDASGATLMTCDSGEVAWSAKQ